jgi:hypothetical protein
MLEQIFVPFVPSSAKLSFRSAVCQKTIKPLAKYETLKKELG